MKKLILVVVLFLSVLNAKFIVNQEQINVPVNSTYPHIAFDGTNYLVVWAEHRGYTSWDIYGSRVMQDGTVLDTIVICNDSDLQICPRVAFNGTNYLVIWQDGARSNYNTFSVKGKRMTPAGVILDPSPIAIGGGLHFGMYAPTLAICSDGNNWMVVWIDEGLWTIDFRRRVVYSDGSLGAVAYLWQDGPDANDLQPSMAFDGTNYLLVYSVKKSSDYYIKGRRISTDGYAVGSAFTISSASDTRGSPCVAFDGINYLVAWQDNRSGNQDIYGARVTPAGSVLGTFSISTATGNQTEPSVAFDGTNYTVAWGDLRDGITEYIYGARVDTTGAVLDPAGVQLSTVVGQTPEMAFGATDYFVVWKNYLWGESLYDYAFIHGSRITTSCTSLDPEGIIIGPAGIEKNYQFFSSVAYDGNNYFAVWEENRNGTFDIYGTRIDTLGNIIDNTAIRISNSVHHAYNPCVAFDGTNYFVVWEDYRDSGDFTEIYGARVTPEGTVLDAGIKISFDTGHKQSPSVAFDETRYLVVWENVGDTLSDIYGARVDTDGSVVDNPPISISTAARFQSIPQVCYSPDRKYLVVWQDKRNGNWDVYGARVRKTGAVDDPGGIPISAGVNAEVTPAVASEGSDWLVLWADYRNGTDYDIYGSRVDISGSVLDPLGIPVSTGSDFQIYPAVSFNDTDYVALWQDYRGGSSYDIYGAEISASGTVGTEFSVSPSDGDQDLPSLANGPGNKMLFAWSEYTSSPYDTKRIWADLYPFTPHPPVSPYIYAQKTLNKDSVMVYWHEVDKDTLGHPVTIDHYSIYASSDPAFIPGAGNLVAQVPDTFFIEPIPVYGTNRYYLVFATSTDNKTSKKSNMGYAFYKFVNENPGVTSDRNWTSLPWHSEYTIVSDLTTDLSPGGDPLVEVTNLRDDQLYENYTYIPGFGWLGIDFSIDPGRGYELVTANDTDVVLVGSNNPDGLVTLNENPGSVSDRNWVSIPYNAIYSTVSDITTEYSPGGDPLVEVTNLRDDQLYENYTYIPGFGWLGVDFAISAGRGYEFVVNIDTTWNPSEYTNEAKGLIAKKSKMRGVDVHLGTLTEPERAPVWIIPLDSKHSVKPDDFELLELRSSELSSRSTSSYREPGISHIVFVYVDMQDLDNLVFTTYRSEKPNDVLTENVIGCGTARKHGCGVLWFNTGNFTTPWQEGEEVILIIEAEKRGKGYFSILNFKLDKGVDIQGLGEVTLAPIPEPTFGQGSVSWDEIKDLNVVGYSLYQGDERLNEKVINRNEYSVQGDVILKPVIKGGYETMYGSQGASYNHKPISYAFAVYPNPFVKKTRIDYALPHSTKVNIKVYDVSGRQVKTLVSNKLEPGYYKVNWFGGDDIGRKVPAGVYFIKINVQGFDSQRKVILIR